MTPIVNPNPANPSRSKFSPYSRSVTFRVGVWALAAAAALILWHGFKNSLQDGTVKLVTEDGIVVERRLDEGESVRNLGTARERQKIESWRNQPLILFLLITGWPLTAIGFLLSLRSSTRSTAPNL